MQNVPPAWSAVQSVWVWHDARGESALDEAEILLSDRLPWWEDMIAEVHRCQGQLALT